MCLPYIPSLINFKGHWANKRIFLDLYAKCSLKAYWHREMVILMSKIKLIFFDGDGTLWYPKKTKYKAPPWIVYNKNEDLNKTLKRQMLIPNVRKTFKYLKKNGIKLAIISTQPDKTKKMRDERLHSKLKYFGIEKFFDYVESSKVVSNHAGLSSKDKEILKILKRTHIPKSSALMVGDVYESDYLPAKRVGIKAVLVDGFKYEGKSRLGLRIRRKIYDISEILMYIK